MNKPSRRNFLKKSIALPAAYTASRVGGVSMLNMAMGAGMLTGASGAAQAADCTGGPRTLVCLFMAGGADSFNMFVPLSNDKYSEYRNTRNDLAVNEADLLEVSDASQGAFGFHSLLGSFKDM